MGLITVIECVDLDATTGFLHEQLGGRVDSISPADSPSEVMMTVGDAQVCVRRSARDQPIHLIVTAAPGVQSTTLTAPNGSTIEVRPESTDLVIPPSVPSLTVTRSNGDFGVGRAGMEYRDLLPDRWGGRFIASNIRIVREGPVADYVHYHRIRFQMIFCARGWVDLVYEDQGEPFRLNEGDCVLQPPEIRHRVLHNSADFEVIEIGCPAVHDTMVEHDIMLPTVTFGPDRDFGGQRFVRHVAADAERVPYLVDGMLVRDTGITDATNGLAGARVIEVAVSGAVGATTLTHDGEFVMVVMLHGAATLTIDGGPAVEIHDLKDRDAVALPPGSRWTWSDSSDGLEFLEVSLPAGAVGVSASTCGRAEPGSD